MMWGLPGCFALWLSSQSQFGSGRGANIDCSNKSSGSNRSSKMVKLNVCIPSTHTHNPNLCWILLRKNEGWRNFSQLLISSSEGVNNNWSWISEWTFYPLMQWFQLKNLLNVFSYLWNGASFNPHFPQNLVRRPVLRNFRNFANCAKSLRLKDTSQRELEAADLLKDGWLLESLVNVFRLKEGRKAT